MKILELKNRKLSLTNSGKLSLFFVGIGSAFAKRIYQTNLLIIKGDDHVLVDCGTRFSQALFELGHSITDIKTFLITHSHADHIGGLEEASLMGRYFAKKKPGMVITESYQDILWDMSLRGGCSFNEENKVQVLGFADFWDVIRPVRLENYPRETFEAVVGNINLKMFRTKHIPDSSKSWETSFWSCGLIIDEKVMFTSDTRYDEELIVAYDRLFKLESIFHDCQFFTGGVHASLDELNGLPQEIKAKTILVHYGDSWETYEERAKEYGFKALGRQHVYYQYE
ncbi:MAG: MBL fold metallo-hydrolase [Brevinematales bacterium]